MILQTVKELEAKNHFLTIDKSHNSVINYRNLPINNSKRDILDTNAYAKFEYLSYRTETKCGRTTDRRTDGQTNGYTDGQRENMYPATNVWRGIKMNAPVVSEVLYRRNLSPEIFETHRKLVHDYK